MDNNYWKEKYADMHLRLTNKIAELEKENEELHKYVDELKEQIAKSVSNDLTLVAIKDFFQKVLNGEV